MENVDIDVDNARVAEVATYLGARKGHILDQLNGLHVAVTNLLTLDGGLFLTRTSPTLQGGFTEFNGQLTSAISAIQNFADIFTQTVVNLDNMDIGLSKKPDPAS